MSDWIEWESRYGYRPEPPDALIEVRYRDGSTDSGLAWEWNQRWSHGDGPTDIVAYRVISEPTKTENDGWIKWHGGACPVPEDTLVEVRLRNGRLFTTCYPELDLAWRHGDGPTDIVAYRVLSEPAKPEEPSPNAHYRQGEIECIDAIRAALTDEEWRGYCKGNVMKYVWRERHKGGDDTLVKAQDYLRWAIAGKAEGKR